MRMVGPLLSIFFASSCGMKKPFQTTHPWKNTVRVKILVKNFLRRVKKISVKFTKGTVEEPQKTFTPPQKRFLRFLQRTFSEFYEKKVFTLLKKFFSSIFTLTVFFQGCVVWKGFFIPHELAKKISKNGPNILIFWHYHRCKKKCHFHVFPSVKTDSCVAGCSNYHQKIPPWKIQQG